MCAGKLWVCATPIGNLGDVTVRVLEALRTADFIAAEDTRVTRTLLSRYGIETPMVAYHARSSESRTRVLLERIEAGDHVALVSDAGTPGISDPGVRLIGACVSAGLSVSVLPGPSAIITAVVASGLPTNAFYFGGFLPRKDGERRARLAALAQLDATLVFYESPRRTRSTLAVVAEMLPDREVCVARELTKVYEEVVRGAVGDVLGRFDEREIKGEVTLIIGPPPRRVRPTLDEREVLARHKALTAKGLSRSDAVRTAAEELGVSRREVYRVVTASQKR